MSWRVWASDDMLCAGYVQSHAYAIDAPIASDIIAARDTAAMIRPITAHALPARGPVMDPSWTHHAPDPAADILGSSAAIAELRRLAPKIAQSDAPTLITGATGTGKEHVARVIHRRSPRAAQAFVALNCAAIPDTLFESELFGFERGSFTGATRSQRGKAVAADGGTLFLDEIAELTPFCQSKLLRMLEEHEVHPLGATRPLSVNLRVIAATNRHVEDAVASGEFRPDLYFRLNVARIAIPALAERPEDIPLYVHHFIAHFNARRGTRVSGIDHELLNLLVGYAWPGNVREIRNFVEGVFIDPPEGLIGTRHIPAAFAHLQRSYTRTGDEEHARLITALEQSNWNKVEAAKRLHWSRMTLYRKLSKYSVERGPGRS
jgi:two-component system, NtrC family, response regulator AtoC